MGGWFECWERSVAGCSVYILNIGVDDEVSKTFLFYLPKLSWGEISSERAES